MKSNKKRFIEYNFSNIVNKIYYYNNLCVEYFIHFKLGATVFC